MALVVNGHAAHVHKNLSRLNRRKGFFLLGERIIYPDQSWSPECLPLFTPGLPQGNCTIEYRLTGLGCQLLITEEITFPLKLVWQVCKRRCQTLLCPCSFQNYE